MLAVVGTCNPVKVKAVENALSRFFQASVVMVEAESGVPPQPIGFEQTVAGAVSRAKGALRLRCDADLGVGIEAGLVPVPGTISGYMDQQFAAIADTSGRVTLGGGPAFEYPKTMVDRITREGIEVGSVMEELTGVSGLGRREGAVGYFSKGAMDRTALTELAVLMALIPRINSGFYFG